MIQWLLGLFPPVIYLETDFLDGWGDFDRPIMAFQVLNLEEKIIEKPVSNVFT